MSGFAARLFDRLQGADFYKAIHQASADLLPDGAGRTWLDVGCGPGLLTRIAARKKFAALGIDLDKHMIVRAQALANGMGSAAQYHVSDLNGPALLPAAYDVVSASSLLVVTKNPSETLNHLLALVKVGGYLLVIEASSLMTRRRATKLVFSGKMGQGAYMLLVWAAVRSGRALSNDIFIKSGRHASMFPLLNGLVNAWLIEKGEVT